jgi:methylmalonyl-CoA decarboxylase
MTEIADVGPVTLSIEKHVATITMDDPERRNVLGRAMLSGLMSAFDNAARAEVRAVILRAAARNSVWCAGFDVKALAPGFDPLAEDGALAALFGVIRALPMPVIAMLTGTAWGGGTDLALRCDIAIATPSATLAFTPARIGLPYDPDGLLNVFLRCGMPMAIEMFATGEPVPADRALAAGLVNHVVPGDEIEAFTRAMAARIAANAPLSVASAKRQLRALNAAMPLSPATLQLLLSERREVLASKDLQEGLAAFAERRTPEFKGS